MKKQDGRVTITTETVNNIKMIKLYAWVDIFQKAIFARRSEERRAMLKRMGILCFTMASLTFFPMLL
jgi:hypothetical protein